MMVMIMMMMMLFVGSLGWTDYRSDCRHVTWQSTPSCSCCQHHLRWATGHLHYWGDFNIRPNILIAR